MKNIFNRKIVLGVLSFVIFTICFCTFSMNSTKVRAGEVAVTEETVEDFLTVKCQVKTTGTGDAQTADLRIVSTVDQLSAYNKAGFEIYFLGGRSESVTEYHYTYEKTGVKRSIDATDNGVRYEYIPQIFDEKSNYFITVTITGITYEEFNANILVQPFVTDSDNNRIYGASRYFTINDGLKQNVVNLSVKEDELKNFNTSSLAVNIDDTNCEFESFCDTTKYMGSDFVTEDELNAWPSYRHFRISMDDTSTLSSVTDFVITDGSNSKTISHRNLYSQLKGSGDTTWYDEVKTEYVLVTAADLYGFQSLVAADTPIKFEEKTVHIGTDIVVNDVQGCDVSSWGTTAPAHAWSGVDNDFAGSIEGHGKAISGLYRADGGYIGLLNEKETVNNLKLTDSYIGGTTDVTGLADSGIILSDVYLSDGSKLDTVESKISITPAKEDVLPLTNTNSSELSDFVLNSSVRSEGYKGIREVGYKDGQLVVVLKHCLCGNATSDGDNENCITGCDGELLTWYPTDSLPTQKGEWYLVESYTTTARYELASNVNVCVDLNGQTITSNVDNSGNNQAIYLGQICSLTFTDSSDEGIFKLKEGKVGGGNLFYMNNASAQMKIYGGTFDASVASASKSGIGFTVRLQKGNLEVYDGTIKCGSDSSATGNITLGDTQGNTQGNTASFILYNGEIVGNSAKQGGAVYIHSGSTFIMHDGTITGGKSINNGGNIAIVGGTFTMNGGVIENGSAGTTGSVYGGNVFLGGSATKFEMTGGLITGGAAAVAGSGNVYVAQKTKITGGKIDGLFFVNSAYEVSLSGRTIIDGDTDGHIGVTLNHTNAKLAMEENQFKLGASIKIHVADEKQISYNWGSNANTIVSVDSQSSEYEVYVKPIENDTATTYQLWTRERNTTENENTGEILNLLYDDILDLSEAPYGVDGNESVVIDNRSVISKQVANGQLDSSVLTYDESTMTLYAAGVGTATLKIGDTTYNVTVEPAPISVFLIGGHSVSAGVGGNPEHSVVCPVGQVYSTYESYITDKVNENWGWEYNWSLSETTNLTGVGIGRNAAQRPETIDALTEGNTGTYGSGSGLAYQWNQLTGEKVWVVNAGHGGMGLSEWREGAVDYVHATELMENVLAVLENEIFAGHYTFSRMEFFYFSCANGDQTWFNEDYADAFQSMWNGFKKELAMHLDRDDQKETFEAIGLVPHWRPGGFSAVSQEFNNGQTYNYYMAAGMEFSDVYIASSLCRNFDDASSDAIHAMYPTERLGYSTQNGIAPSDLIPDVMKGSNDAVFPDNIHCAQLTQNLQGMIMAESLYARVYGTNATEDITVYKPDGVNTIANNETIELSDFTEYRLTVMLDGAVQGDLTFETEGCVDYNGTFITTGSTTGSGKLIIKHGGTTIHTVNFNVTQGNHHRHCDCTGNYSDHECSSVVWKAWNSSNSLPTESGYYYLTNDVNIIGYANILNGNKVHLCLNGHTITKVNNDATGWVGRIYQMQYAGELTVTDCGEEGRMIGNNTNQNGGLIQMPVNTNSKLHWYGGTLCVADGITSTTQNGGLIYVTAGSECNIYGGTIEGGKATGNGGCIYNEGTLRISGGTIQNGTSGGWAGNIYVKGDVVITGTARVLNGWAATDGGNIHIARGGSLTIDGEDVVIAGGTVEANKTSNDLNQLTSTSDRSVIIKNGTIGTKSYINGEAQ